MSGEALTILERMELERLRLEALRRAEADRQRARLLADVAHELRSPLTVSQAAMANLADGIGGPVSAMQAEFIEMAQRNLDRLGRLVINALEYARLEAGEAAETTPLDVRRLVSRAAADWKPSLSKHVAVEVDVDAGLPFAKADPDRFMSVVGSLLDLASRHAARRVRVTAGESPGMIRVTVEDDGLAAPDKSWSAGLAICHEVARRFSGRVWHDAAGGRGARFHFELPRQGEGYSGFGGGGTTP